jgi:hypothetical protein
VYAEQAERQLGAIDVVRGPGVGERAGLESTTEEVGAALAKGLAPWLDVGVAVAWRHVRLDGSAVTSDPLGRELQRVTVAGDANKARVTGGLLASFGPGWSPTAFRIGLAYQQDIVSWSVDRSVTDREAGVITRPSRIAIVEPPVASAGIAWRISDVWLVSGQLDYVWYDRVVRAIERARPGEPFALEARFEPRAAIEMTRPSPIGGYYKVRLGARRETSGRLAYTGADPALVQAFVGSPPAFRASGGVSLLAEFYERAVRLDADLSQVVLDRRSTLSNAGTRRFAIALTARL